MATKIGLNGGEKKKVQKVQKAGQRTWFLELSSVIYTLQNKLFSIDVVTRIFSIINFGVLNFS